MCYRFYFPLARRARKHIHTHIHTFRQSLSVYLSSHELTLAHPVPPQCISTVPMASIKSGLLLFYIFPYSLSLSVSRHCYSLWSHSAGTREHALPESMLGEWVSGLTHYSDDCLCGESNIQNLLHSRRS